MQVVDYTMSINCFVHFLLQLIVFRKMTCTWLITLLVLALSRYTLGK